HAKRVHLQNCSHTTVQHLGSIAFDLSERRKFPSEQASLAEHLILSQCTPEQIERVASVFPDCKKITLIGPFQPTHIQNLGKFSELHTLALVCNSASSASAHPIILLYDAVTKTAARQRELKNIYLHGFTPLRDEDVVELFRQSLNVKKFVFAGFSSQDE